jgi:hypothetical protein
MYGKHDLLPLEFFSVRCQAFALRMILDGQHQTDCTSAV